MIDYEQARNMVLGWMANNQVNMADGNALLNFIDMMWGNKK